MRRVILKDTIADRRIEVDLKASGDRKCWWKGGDRGVTSTRRGDHHLQKIPDGGSQISREWRGHCSCRPGMKSTVVVMVRFRVVRIRTCVEVSQNGGDAV